MYYLYLCENENETVVDIGSKGMSLVFKIA